MIDFILFAAYAGCCLSNRVGNNSKTACVSLVCATLTFLFAEIMIQLGTSFHWFHLTICIICCMWAYMSIRLCENVLIAMLATAMALFQIMLSVDGFLYPFTDTLISSNITVVSLIFHCAILLAIFTDGIAIRINSKRHISGNGPSL